MWRLLLLMISRSGTWPADDPASLRFRPVAEIPSYLVRTITVSNNYTVAIHPRANWVAHRRQSLAPQPPTRLWAAFHRSTAVCLSLRPFSSGHQLGLVPSKTPLGTPIAPHLKTSDAPAPGEELARRWLRSIPVPAKIHLRRFQPIGHGEGWVLRELVDQYFEFPEVDPL